MEKVLQQILEKLNNMDNRLSNLEQGQEALRADVTGLQEGQARLEKGQESQGQELKALRSDVARLEKGQQRLELRLEHEVIEKVKVLFDAHSLHLDYFESIRDSQARIEESLDMIFGQLAKLDNQQRNQERELRLLRAKKGQA